MSRGWISEKHYNKLRGGNCSKVLVGNWKEEQVLEGDMMRMGHSLETTRKAENSNRIVGGFESTAFLLSPEDPNTRQADMMTTQRSSFTPSNGDVTKLRKPDMGVRSQLRANQVIQEARDEFIKTQCDRMDAAVPPKTTSTYRETLGGDFEPKRSVEAVQTHYMYDKPITLYNKNPVSGKEMTVQGKSLAANNNAEHNKCTTFSDPKYML